MTESGADLVDAGDGSSAGQVQGPGEAGLEAGGKGIDADGGAQQIDGLAKAMAAEREHGASAGSPRVVGQVS